MIITLEPQDGIWSEIGMHDLQAYRGGKAALLRNECQKPSDASK